MNRNGGPASPESADGLICDALRVAVGRERPGANDITSYLRAARHIRDAMPQAMSIDNFIDSQQGNAQIELCGKLAIVRSILQAERASRLYVDPFGPSRSVDFRALEKTWFNAFFMLLTESCRREQLEERLASITLIIFNYDRCIEHFLYYALQNYYRIAPEQAAALLAKLQIFHPYGTVGWLPWQELKPTVDFGAESSAHELVDLAGEIKTFTEGTDPEASDITTIRDRLVGSDIVLFLGFAFHPLNLLLLRSSGPRHQEPAQVRYYGTTRGISDSDRHVISVDLTTSLACIMAT